MVHPGKKVDFLKLLPVEISLDILSYLDIASLLCASRASYLWYLYTSQDVLWRDMLHKRYSDRLSKSPLSDGSDVQQSSGTRRLLLGSRRCMEYVQACLRRQERIQEKEHAREEDDYTEDDGTEENKENIPPPLMNRQWTTNNSKVVAETKAGQRNERRKSTRGRSRLHLSEWKAMVLYYHNLNMRWLKGRCRRTVIDCKNNLEALSHYVFCIYYVSKSDLIIRGAFDDLVVFNCSDRSEVVQLKGHHGIVTCCDVSEDASMVASGSDDKTIRLWELPSGKRRGLLLGHSAGIESVKLSEEFIVSGSSDSTVMIWEMDTRVCIRTLEPNCGYVNDVCLGYDQLLVGGMEDGLIKVWDYWNGDVLKTLALHTEGVSSVELVALNKECRYIYENSLSAVKYSSITGEGREIDRPVRTSLRSMVFEMNRKRGKPALPLLDDGSLDNRNSHKDLFIVSGGKDKTVVIWDFEYGEPLCQLLGHTEDISCVKCDGSRIVSADIEGEIIVWDFLFPGKLFSLHQFSKFAIACMSLSEEMLFVGSDSITCFDFGAAEIKNRPSDEDS
eukprot:Nk52_evm31s805 gene=Nk52_evmTU31s805